MNATSAKKSAGLIRKFTGIRLKRMIECNNYHGVHKVLRIVAVFTDRAAQNTEKSKIADIQTCCFHVKHIILLRSVDMKWYTPETISRNTPDLKRNTTLSFNSFDAFNFCTLKVYVQHHTSRVLVEYAYSFASDAFFFKHFYFIFKELIRMIAKKRAHNYTTIDHDILTYCSKIRELVHNVL